MIALILRLYILPALIGSFDAAPPGGRQVSLRRGGGAAQERRQGERARQRRADRASPLRQGGQRPGMQVKRSQLAHRTLRYGLDN